MAFGTIKKISELKLWKHFYENWVKYILHPVSNHQFGKL